MPHISAKITPEKSIQIIYFQQIPFKKLDKTEFTTRAIEVLLAEEIEFDSDFSEPFRVQFCVLYLHYLVDFGSNVYWLGFPMGCWELFLICIHLYL